MTQKMTLRHAFTYDYTGRVRELVTPVQFANSSLTHPFDLTKKFISFSRAIGDTGATNTVISPEVVQSLDLKPTGMAEVCGFNGQHLAKTYVVDILLPNKVLVPNLSVTEGILDEGTDEKPIKHADDFGACRERGRKFPPQT